MWKISRRRPILWKCIGGVVLFSPCLQHHIHNDNNLIYNIYRSYRTSQVKKTKWKTFWYVLIKHTKRIQINDRSIMGVHIAESLSNTNLLYSFNISAAVRLIFLVLLTLGWPIAMTVGNDKKWHMHRSLKGKTSWEGRESMWMSWY